MAGTNLQMSTICNSTLTPRIYDKTQIPWDNWDNLLKNSNLPTIFLHSTWIKAWAATLGATDDWFMSAATKNGSLASAAIFVCKDGKLSFAAGERSDYADCIIDESLPDQDAQIAVGLVLNAAITHLPKANEFKLHRVPQDSRFNKLVKQNPDFYSCITNQTPAPEMDMQNAAKALKKKSLVRHDRGLQKKGDVVVETLTDAHLIQPHLECFFEQHISRWQNSDTPSLFNNPKNRDFYAAVVAEMSPLGFLKFTRVLLDGELVAAHFGFKYNDVFTWYKPTYNVNYAKSSPGEVLIKRLIEQAVQDNALIFDFTIGDEKFKYRFATTIKTVDDIWLGKSSLKYSIIRLKQRLKLFLAKKRSS